MKVFAIALNTGREAIRNKILYSIMLFACLVTGIAGSFGSVSIGDRMKFVKDFSLFSISMFGVVTTVVLGVSLLSKELEKRTIYNLLSKPVARWQFLVGKFIGMWTVLILMMGLMTAALFLLLFALEGRFDWQVLAAIAAMILELGVLLAVALFFSTIVVTPVLGGLFTVAAFIAGRSSPWLLYFTRNDQPPFVRALINVIYAILPHLDRFWVADRVVSGHPLPAGYYVDLVIYGVAYSGVLMVLSMVIFRRREFV